MTTVNIDNNGDPPVFLGFFGTRGFDATPDVPGVLDALAAQYEGQPVIYVVPDFWADHTIVINWCIANGKPYQRVVTCSSNVETDNDELVVASMFLRIADYFFAFIKPGVRDPWCTYLEQTTNADETLVETYHPGGFSD